MHKSWGNAIEFDEAAERMGVDVMRWMFAKARPEDNILFGWHAADEARRELLVLWNVYAFFVTYAPAGRLDAATRRIDAATGAAGAAGPRSLDPVAGGRPRRRRRRPPRATSTRVGATRAIVDLHRRPLDVVPAPVAEALLARTTTPADRAAAFATLHARARRRRAGSSRRSCRSCPRSMYGNLVATGRARRRPTPST